MNHNTEDIKSDRVQAVFQVPSEQMAHQNRCVSDLILREAIILSFYG